MCPNRLWNSRHTAPSAITMHLAPVHFTSTFDFCLSSEDQTFEPPKNKHDRIDAHARQTSIDHEPTTVQRRPPSPALGLRAPKTQSSSPGTPPKQSFSSLGQGMVDLDTEGWSLKAQHVSTQWDGYIPYTSLYIPIHPRWYS